MPVDIPVVVDSGSSRQIPSMNVEPILHEVQHALEKLLKSGETSMIDLRAMPLAPDEDEVIKQRLGTGEAVIHIEALGPSILTETAYPGVWWVEHRNNDDVVTGLYIEIAHVPAIVFPANEDLEHGLDTLTENLKSNDHLNGND
jgi:hydrogenase-1 operon protein HyaF